MSVILDQMLRPGRDGSQEVRIDIAWLCCLALTLFATGIGLRDPWPADEPRFALVARDMVAHHLWLIPQVGNDNYPDKPPLFFWLMACVLQLTGSLRFAFLVPSTLAGMGCAVLVYDLARRLWNRETGLAAALALFATLQFVWQPRQAQIDATLCFFTTLSLYGLLRHCLAGPTWRWYVIGWAAAGLGVITKGVGFLPLLVLIPYFVLRAPYWRPRPALSGSVLHWALGPLAFVAVVSTWLAPMLVAVHHDPALERYRNEILFTQTLGRYFHPWHHFEPVWFFIVNVIPGLWLPLTGLLPWLIPRWRQSLRGHDLRVALPLAWIVMVVLFFSFSEGKRSVYVLPAVPALALACGPWLNDIAGRGRAQHTVFAVTCSIAAICITAGMVLTLSVHERHRFFEAYDLNPVALVGPLLTIGVLVAFVCIIARPGRGFAAYGLAIAASLLVISLWINPELNEARSGARFMHRVQSMTLDVRELGLVAYRDEYLLNVTRPVTTFGHARWREAEQEADDAAAWLAAAPGRVLLVDQRARDQCFTAAHIQPVDTQWSLVRGAADLACTERGKLSAALFYEPAKIDSDGKIERLPPSRIASTLTKER
ncbi:MAG TPA: glycosyltransferase family 39 protein [Steroidobacteraceae bacterium]|jgi:4-amino-4-deoxy-L-arabinose transferase-like glycosyltransferase